MAKTEQSDLLGLYGHFKFDNSILKFSPFDPSCYLALKI